MYCVLSQGEAANWYFGVNAGLNFSSGAPVLDLNGQLATNEGCGSISDANGDLLFYTDGITVWDKNHNQMPNGFGLLGDPSSTQSGIIIPLPGSEVIRTITCGRPAVPIISDTVNRNMFRVVSD